MSLVLVFMLIYVILNNVEIMRYFVSILVFILINGIA